MSLEDRVEALELANMRLGPSRGSTQEEIEEVTTRLLAALRKKESMKTRCKMTCSYKQEQNGGVHIHMSAVTSGSPENVEFFKFTPGATLQMWTVNPESASQFELGHQYYLDISRAE